jgi:hypothetical protein
MFPWFKKAVGIRFIKGRDHKRCMIIPITRHGVQEYATSLLAPVINIKRVRREKKCFSQHGRTYFGYYLYTKCIQHFRGWMSPSLSRRKEYLSLWTQLHKPIILMIMNSLSSRPQKRRYNFLFPYNAVQKFPHILWPRQWPKKILLEQYYTYVRFFYLSAVYSTMLSQ